MARSLMSYHGALPPLLVGAGALALAVLLRPSTLEAVLFRVRLVGTSTLQVLFSKDWQGKLPPDADMIKDEEGQEKTLVFIRHGESEWNEIFNRGWGPGLLWRLGRAAVREILLMAGCDSLLFDSPLSEHGIAQALALREVLRNGQLPDRGLQQLLLGDKGSPPSVLVCSNLRRSIATACLVLQDHLHGTMEPLHVLSCLQEASRNPDTIALTPKHEAPALPVWHKYLWGSLDATRLYGLEMNTGTKDWACTAMHRVQTFAEYMFARPEGTVVVGGGHSLYLRLLLAAYLPHTANHPAARQKLANCGILVLTIKRASHAGRVMYRVDPDSIRVVWGGLTSL